MPRASFLAASVALFAACAGTPVPPQPNPPPPFSASIFDVVPAETPYIFASEQFGSADFDHAMGAYQDYFTEVPDLLRQLTPYMDVEARDPETYALIIQALEFVAEWASGEQARDVGIAWPMQSVIYGVGLWPTLRIALDDPDRARVFLQRQLADADIAFEGRTYQGQPYSVVSFGEVFSILIAVHRDTFVASLTYADALDVMLPYLLPTQALQRNIGHSGRLAAIVAERGFLPQSVGLVDLAAVTRRILSARGPDSVIGQALGVSLDPDEQCSQELLELVDTLPTVEFGMRQLDAKGMASEFVIPLTDAEVADAVLATVGTDSALVQEPWENPDLSMSLSVDMVGVSNLYTLVARRLRDRAFQCELLQELTQRIKSEAVQFAMLSRIAFGGLRGAHVRVRNLAAFGGEGVPNMLGVVVHDQPLQVLSWLSAIASYAFPETDDGVPVELSQDPAIRMAVKGSLIAVSVDADAARAAVLSGGSGGQSPLFVMETAGSLDSIEAKMGFEDAAGAWADLPPYPAVARIQGPLGTIDGTPVSAATYYEGYGWSESQFPDSQIPMLEVALVDSTLEWAKREIALDHLGFEARLEEEVAVRFDRYLNRRGAPKITPRKIRAHYRKHKADFIRKDGVKIPLDAVESSIKTTLVETEMRARVEAFDAKHLGAMTVVSNLEAVRAKREAAWGQRDAIVARIVAIEDEIEASVRKSSLVVTAEQGKLIMRSTVENRFRPARTPESK